MASTDRPSDEHQVGITNAQEDNPDATIADLTRRMNSHFAAGEYAEAADIALQITALSKDELRQAFEQHGVQVLYLDHEAFGIYAGQIEPTYDTLVDGPTPEVLAAATEFGKRHAQEMVLIAKKLKEGESDPNERMGVTIALHEPIPVGLAVGIADLVRDCGFAGATFAPKRDGEVAIYHTAHLGMTDEQFLTAASTLIGELKKWYSGLTFSMHKFIIHMPNL